MRAEGTRAAILGAAVEIGSLRGLEELTMGGLASAVEMSKSGLFAHFGSKQELQLATVARRLGDLERQTSALESAVRAANESGELRVRKEPRKPPSRSTPYS